MLKIDIWTGDSSPPPKRNVGGKLINEDLFNFTNRAVLIKQ